jgi:ribosomal protein S6--L-glutamate ligase
MRDKITSTRALQAAGVPVPHTFVAAHAKQFAPLLDEPLVVKPYRGSQGRGVRVVWDAEELEDVGAEGGPVFAQRYHKPEGEDRKIYCIGGQLFGVLRTWPAHTYEEKLGRPFTITPELRDIALRCGQAFGVDLFGLDIIISEGRPYVVDIQAFPGFKGVPDAALHLADYIYTVAERVMSGGPVSNTVLLEAAS